MIKKTEIDYLNYNDLNEVEAKIKEYTDKVSSVTSIPSFNQKTWNINELPFIQEIDRIEKGIYNLGEYYNRPKGWLTTKEWITSDNLYPIKSFDYRDWNRWLNNLNIFYTDIDLTDTIWNGASFLYWNTPWYLANLKLNGITKQETRSGKNLFDISNVVSNWNSSTNIGVRNNNDGTLTVSAPSTSSSVQALAPNKLSDYCPNLKVGDVVYLNATTTGTQKYIYLLKSASVWSFGSSARTITQNDLDSGVLWYSSGVSTSATISNIMISASGGEYEPYTGGQPSPNPDYPQEIEVATGSVSVKSTGKNLALITSINNKNYPAILENGILTINGTSARLGNVNFNINNASDLVLKANKTYTISLICSGIVAGPTYKSVYLKLGDSPYILMGSLGNNKTISYTYTPEEDIVAKFVNIDLGANNTFENYVVKFQIEENEQVTEYEPYKESSITYNLGDNFLADKDYIENGVLNKNVGKVVVTNGNFYDGGTWKGYYVNIPNKLRIKNNYLVCDRAIFDKLANKTENTVYENVDTVMFVGNADDTLETLQQKFNGAIIYYELATPQQIPLETTGELEIFEGETNITNDLDSEMEATIKNYKTDEELTKTGNNIQFNIEEKNDSDVEWR